MKHLEKQEFWEEAWVRHLEIYLGKAPRCGIWLRKRFGAEVAPILEIAGGSCRDSRYLADKGIQSTGSDFDTKTLDYLRHKYPDSPLDLKQADGANMPFADKSYGLSFSNGFWVCFKDDEKIKEFALEQARVTRKWLLALVHNSRNQALVEDFGNKAQKDPLFDIRFFDPDEIVSLVESFGLGAKSVTVEKFGGWWDRFYQGKLKGLPNALKPFASGFVPPLYQRQSWETTERVACIVELS